MICAEERRGKQTDSTKGCTQRCVTKVKVCHQWCSDKYPSFKRGQVLALPIGNSQTVERQDTWEIVWESESHSKHNRHYLSKNTFCREWVSCSERIVLSESDDSLKILILTPVYRYWDYMFQQVKQMKIISTFWEMLSSDSPVLHNVFFIDYNYVVFFFFSLFFFNCKLFT